MPKEIVTSGGLFVGVPIPGATAATYDPTADDANEILYCEVTATNTAGSAMEQSAPTGEIAAIAPVNTIAPALTGTETEGETISVTEGTWTGDEPITYSYQLYRANTIITHGPELVIYPLDEVADSADWNIVGDTVVRTGSGGSYSLETTELPVIGLTYRIALTVTGHSGDSMSARFGQGGGTNQVTGNGDWVFTSLAANNNNLTFGAWDGTPAGATISDISVRVVIDNLLLKSQAFDDGAVWGAQNANITANAAVAPDGTMTADKLYETAVTGAIHTVYQGVVFGSTEYCFSIYAKAAERRYMSLNVGGQNDAVVFDLQDGVITMTEGVAVGAIEDVGDGWYRCSFATTVAANYVVVGLSDSATYTVGDIYGRHAYDGVANSGIYLWGSQLEPGSVATTYRPKL